MTLLALQLANLVHDSKTSAGHDVLARSTHLVAAVAACIVSFLEHGRSVKPSDLLLIYLAASIFNDIIQAGLLYVAWNLCNPIGLPLATFVVKSVLLVVESQPKTDILRKPYDKLGPEDTSGVFGLVFFWWANHLLWLGNTKILSSEDLPAMQTDLDALKIRGQMQAQWDKRSKFGGPIA